MSVINSGGEPKNMPCLICGQLQPKNTFMAHISDHLSYRQHKCQDCDFRSITAEEMGDHEAANMDHTGQLYALRNPYMDRVCRFIYNDCDFGDKNGGIVNVLKRKLFGNDEELLQQQQQPHTPMAARGSAEIVPSMFLKPDDCALSSSKAPTGHQQLIQQHLGGPVGHQWDVQLGCWVPVATAMRADFAAGNSANNFMGQQSAGGGASSSAGGFQQSALEKFIAEQQQQHMGGQLLFQPAEAVQPDGQHQIGAYHSQQSVPTTVEEPSQHEKLGKKKYKEVFENVQCLKCGQWVKGRGICLLYHINTRHLKLPLYRCLACPRDFFYVTDTTAKNHIRSFHGNDLSLLENNYSTLSKILHDSRREFYGASKSEKKAGILRAKKVAAKSLATRRQKGQKKKGAGGNAQILKAVKEINFRERPQAGSGVVGNSSHVQCNQCGDFVATIYSSQLSHMNTKHLHLPVYSCKVCDRAFESLSMSAAVMHIKSIHGKSREDAEQEIVDRRSECLKQLNEGYRAYFS